MPIVPIQPAQGLSLAPASGPDPLSQRHHNHHQHHQHHQQHYHAQQPIHEYHHSSYPHYRPPPTQQHPYSTVPVPVPVSAPAYYPPPPAHHPYDLPPVRDTFGGSNNAVEHSIENNNNNNNNPHHSNQAHPYYPPQQHLYQHHDYPQQQSQYNYSGQEYGSSRHSSPDEGGVQESHLFNRSGTPDSVTTAADGGNPQDPNKTSKGKLFQCTGFGDCRMVFTRSEHLARHARKHTGEKPFQCVVDGCTRMFSRFDNMVQHTQTHTKGPHRESADLIASKIAIESRRKSEAGLLTGTTTRRHSIKSTGGSKSNRNSITSVPESSEDQKVAVSDAVIKSSNKHQRMQSLPMLSVSPSSGPIRSITPALPSPVTPSSMAGSPNSPTKLLRSTARKDSAKIRKRASNSGIGGIVTSSAAMSSAGLSRRGSLGSVADRNSSAESWYASKLHHRTSLDFSLDQRAYLSSMEAMKSTHGQQQRPDAYLPPMNQYIAEQDYSTNRPSFPRHPLSPEHSSHSDDMDSDDAGYHMHPHHQQQQQQQPRSEMSTPDQGWRGTDNADDSMAHCILPPLRTAFPEGETLESQQQSARLPSIHQHHHHHGRFRSQTIHSSGSEPYPPANGNKLRRLSLVDLNVPIQEATKAVHHSIPIPPIEADHHPLSVSHTQQPQQEQPRQFQPPEQKMEGVDVSEDEIKALEAFGELWSQGRDVEMKENSQPRTLSPASAASVPTLVTKVKIEPVQQTTSNGVVPGPDFGRRAYIKGEVNYYGGHAVPQDQQQRGMEVD
ncbi:hypothetical protein BGZ83_008026 [Gryganskiella cystojenkinii]|nr:hypothetical protein BGZ83_008026 [Gryganskiella cystojenkinii]